MLDRVASIYARHELAYRQGKCIYCGDIGGETDHVPAISWLYSLGSDYFAELNVSAVTVPACRWCNAKLSNFPYHTVKTRKRFIYLKLEELHRKAIGSPKWDEEEMAELGFALRHLVKSYEEFRNYLERRMEWARTEFRWDNP